MLLRNRKVILINGNYFTIETIFKHWWWHFVGAFFILFKLPQRELEAGCLWYNLSLDLFLNCSGVFATTTVFIVMQQTVKYFASCRYFVDCSASIYTINCVGDSNSSLPWLKGCFNDSINHFKLRLDRSGIGKCFTKSY